MQRVIDAKLIAIETKPTDPFISLKKYISLYFKESLSQRANKESEQLFQKLNTELQNCENLPALTRFLEEFKERYSPPYMVFPEWISNTVAGAFAILIQNDIAMRNDLIPFTRNDLNSLAREPFSKRKMYAIEIINNIFQLCNIPDDKLKLKETNDELRLLSTKVIQQEQKEPLKKSLKRQRSTQTVSALGHFAPIPQSIQPTDIEHAKETLPKKIKIMNLQRP